MSSLIGVAIPCYKYHIPVLKRCLDSIEAQTVKPAFVVVHCSSSRAEDIPEVYRSSYSFLLRIVTIEQRLNAAQNRNRAAEILLEAGCQIFSFFDCDDEMHPQRLEMICEAWKKFPQTQIILHSYFYTAEDLGSPFPMYPQVSMSVNTLRKAPSGCAVVEGDWRARIHHSQVTVSKDIALKHRFPEDASLERREDSLFCGAVLSSPGIQSVYIKNSLSKYYEEGATREV